MQKVAKLEVKGKPKIKPKVKQDRGCRVSVIMRRNDYQELEKSADLNFRSVEEQAYYYIYNGLHFMKGDKE